MNQQARDLLVNAALQGRPQITKAYHSGNGDCAIGVLHDLSEQHNRETCMWRERPALISQANDTIKVAGLSVDTRPCPVEKCFYAGTEGRMISHLNDEHKWDFLTIARELP